MKDFYLLSQDRLEDLWFIRNDFTLHLNKENFFEDLEYILEEMEKIKFSSLPYHEILSLNRTIQILNGYLENINEKNDIVFFHEDSFNLVVPIFKLKNFLKQKDVIPEEEIVEYFNNMTPFLALKRLEKHDQFNKENIIKVIKSFELYMEDISKMNKIIEFKKAFS